MSRRPIHPWIFMVLILPFGMMSGYLTVAVAYLLTKAGVSVGDVAGLIAISFIPHTWKFLWAPVADTTLGRKTWYVIACVLSAVGFWATGAFPATRAGLAALTVVVLVANVAVTFLGMSVESLMAYETPENEKGRAGGWLCDRMNRKEAYSLYGVLQALCAVAMAIAPRTQTTYVMFTLIYAFITGLTFAGFSAFVLEAMGLGAAATKFSLFASLSNMPIAYMTSIDGWAYGRWGAIGMLLTEAVVGAVGLVLFLGVLAFVFPVTKSTDVCCD